MIAELGGLHRFMSWDGPILTDSGGFQVFSLRDTIVRADDEGVTFRSVYDGEAAHFTPEAAAAIQRQLGSRHRHVPRHLPARRRLDRGPRRRRGRTTRVGGAAARRAAAPTASCSSGSRREAPTPSCAARSIDEIGALDFDGYALGGLSVGEDRETDARRPSRGRRRSCPAGKPRYFMGIGDPEGILEVVERGIDMFDCVLPTRLGRTGTALTWEGRLNLKNARFARDPAPLEEGCPARPARASRAPISATS